VPSSILLSFLEELHSSKIQKYELSAEVSVLPNKVKFVTLMQRGQ
jgi:hypothetical protein